jgi:sulfide dehydrogenase cytochrome subunit
MPGFCRIFVAIFVLFMLPAQAQDPFKSCARCHGADGNSGKSPNPSISSLADTYIASSLKAYQDGSRDCGFSKMKCKMASRWTAEEVDAAAKHFSQQPRTRAPQEFDAGLAAQGKAIHQARCAECHSGTGAEGQGGLLQGQWRDYLDYAMGQYREGKRSQPAAMKAATSALEAAEWEALLHYYASEP